MDISIVSTEYLQSMAYKINNNYDVDDPEHEFWKPKLGGEQYQDYIKKIYDTLDEFILIPTSDSSNFLIDTNDTFDISIFSICIRHLEAGQKMYKKMKNDPKQNFDTFGSNAGGYTSFSLYKSKDQNIYLIVIKGQKLTNYVKIENENIFGIEDDENENSKRQRLF